MSLPVHEYGISLHLFRFYWFLSSEFCSFPHADNIYILYMYNTTTCGLKETYFGYKDTKRLKVKGWKRYSMKIVTKMSRITVRILGLSRVHILSRSGFSPWCTVYGLKLFALPPSSSRSAVWSQSRSSFHPGWATCKWLCRCQSLASRFSASRSVGGLGVPSPRSWGSKRGQGREAGGRRTTRFPGSPATRAHRSR